MRKYIALLILFAFSVPAQSISTNNESKFMPLILEQIKKIDTAKEKGNKPNIQVQQTFSKDFMPIDENLRIMLKIKVKEVTEEIKQLLISKGCKIKNSSTHDIFAWVPYETLNEIAEIDEVLSIGSKGAIVHNRTTVEGEGLSLLNGSKAGDYFFIDGSGIGVGVISDGMNYSSASRSHDELSSIHSVDGSSVSSNYPGSEGTAMLEIIYDFAPGAELWFGGIDNLDNYLDYADRITHLAQNDCKVIVDDIHFKTGYSYFQEKEISSAINQFISTYNGCYISAAGNSHGLMYTGTEYDVDTDNFIKFDNSTVKLSFTPSIEGEIIIVLQWADDWEEPDEDFDLYIYNNNNVQLASSAVRGYNSNPEEVCAVSVSANEEYYAMIKWYDYTSISQNREIKIHFYNDDDLNLEPSTEEKEILEHRIAENVICVAATDASNGSTVESYSSRGPTVIYTNSGNINEEQQPVITAADGVETYVGQQGNFNNPFYGTSAAAPHIAGIAALYFSKYPNKGYLDFKNAMTSTATAMSDGGSPSNPNYISGYGRADALGIMINNMTTQSNTTFSSNTNISNKRLTGSNVISSGVTVTIPEETTISLKGSLSFGNSASALNVSGALIIEDGASVSDFDNIHLVDDGKLLDLSGSYIGVIVDQQLSNGNSTDSDIQAEVWQSSAWSSFSVPKSFFWNNNSNQTLRAYQSITLGEKYNHWENASEILNHKTFEITEETNKITAIFDVTHSGISIKNALEGTSATGGNIQFKDPWFIDYMDTDYGSSLRNRGINAIFRTRSSPFTPDYSTTYENSQAYKGVFLNQDYTIAGQPYYSVNAPSPQTISINGTDHTFYFTYWSATGATLQDADEEETAVVFTSSNAVVSANYKATQISSDATAYSNNGQRRLIETLGGRTIWLHQVYESMGHIWIEHSRDKGKTWLLGNNGQPLDGTAGGKNPSIAHTSSVDGYNFIGVVWQQKYGSYYQIKGKMFNQKNTVSATPTPVTGTTTLYTETSETYSGVNANPNLALAEGPFSPYFVTFEKKAASGDREAGINWLAGYIDDVGSAYCGQFENVIKWGVVEGTDANTTNTQMSQYLKQDTYYSEIAVNFIRQQGSPGKIYSHFLGFVYGTPSTLGSYYQIDDGLISYNAAVNSAPSIVTMKDTLYVYSSCWIEYNDLVFYSYRDKIKYYYGDYVKSCSINGGGGSNDGFVVWSQNLNSNWTNKSIQFDEARPVSSTQTTLSTTGQYVQLGNNPSESAITNMYVSSFYPSTLPYYFEISSSALSKENTEVVSGRGFEINNEEANFSYIFGNLNVEGENIGFIEVPDTADYEEIEILNNALITEPFQISAGSKIVFSERSGFADSTAAVESLGKDGYVNYQVELIDPDTYETVGTVKTVALTSSNVYTLQTLSYLLDTEGLADQTVRAKITLDTNIDTALNNVNESLSEFLKNENIPLSVRNARKNSARPALLLIKKVSEQNETLEKSSLNEISMEETDVPTTYALAQNYPNPFNPATTINYQIPEDGKVTLKIYDILGREVITLVDNYKTAGKYEVRFDASNLASGVYIYRLTSKEYNSSKKMVLLK